MGAAEYSLSRCFCMSLVRSSAYKPLNYNNCKTIRKTSLDLYIPVGRGMSIFFGGDFNAEMQRCAEIRREENEEGEDGRGIFFHHRGTETQRRWKGEGRGMTGWC